MEYRSKYKAEEIEAILDAKNNTGEGVDSNLDEMFSGQLQTKEVEVSADTTIKADEGFLGLKEVGVKVKGGGSSEEKVGMVYIKKEALFSAFGTNAPVSMSQDQLRAAILSSMGYNFPLVGFKEKDGDIRSLGMALGEELTESRFTYDNWDAVALDWDSTIVTPDGLYKSWQILEVATAAEAKVILSQMFPNQLTEDEFFGRA